MTSWEQLLGREQTLHHPWAGGTFDARPGLSKLGSELVFDFDRQSARLISNKLELHRAGLMHRHYLLAALAPQVRARILELIASRLCADWPEFFEWRASVFTSRLLGLSARLNLASGEIEDFDDSRASSSTRVQPLDALDFLALNVPEDLAVWVRDPWTQTEWLSALHVSAPHHWDPRLKIGQSFASVHAPVADIGPTVAVASKLARAAVEQGPFVRFAWGPAANDTPNHHPDAPHEGDRDGSLPELSSLYLRVERQTLTGLAEVNAALFTIRPYWYPILQVAAEPERRAQLCSALESMSDAALAYKSLVHLRDPLVNWLRSL